MEEHSPGLEKAALVTKEVRTLCSFSREAP